MTEVLPLCVRREVLTYLSAGDLGQVQMTSSEWKETAEDVSQFEVVMRIGDFISVREVENTLNTQSKSRSWTRSLRSYERLAEIIRTPSGKGLAFLWREEWKALEKLRNSRSASKEVEELSPEHSLRYVISSTEYKIQKGWPSEIAIGYTLLMTKFKAILGESIRNRSHSFAASCHLISAALTWRLHLENEVAPLAYNDLDGPYGLRRADPAWSALLAAQVGVSFYTSTPVETSASPACLSEQGFRAPLIDVNGDNDNVEYQPQNSDIVCFQSRPADATYYKSLIRTAHTKHELQYDLPPLAKIYLVSIQEPGQWSAFNDSVRPLRRLYTVHVTFL